MGGLVRWPVIVSPFFIGVILAMAYELTQKILRTDDISSELVAKRAQAAEIMEALAVAADAGNVGVWIRNIDSGKVWASEKWREIFGFFPDEELTVDSFYSRIVEEDRERIKQIFTNATEAGHYAAEYRMRAPDGSVRWIDSHGKGGTSYVGKNIMYGASADVTQRKLADQSVENLGGRLINAQEAERAHIARELHDDLSQNLALLAIRLEMLGNKAPEHSELVESISGLSAQVQTLSADIHRLSHELHPAKLEQLGLTPAIRGYCRELGEARGLRIEFIHDDLPASLPNDVALCIYRVVQEALQNVAKHSGAGQAFVEVQTYPDRISLEVKDNGKGFDTRKPLSDSIGLVGMNERVRAVKGSLSVNSNIGNGTTVKAEIPFTDHSSAQAHGV